MLSITDKEQITDRGINISDVEEQLEFFKKGIPFLDIIKPATVSDGIGVLGDKQLEDYVKYFDDKKVSCKLVKFVPASGAATRMFKSLFEYLSSSDSGEEKNINSIIADLKLFAFYPDLDKIIKVNGESLESLIKNNDFKKIIDYILMENGLEYGNLPKGLLKFHKYSDGNRTAAEEHLIEGATYAQNSNKSIYIHFTVSLEHLEKFNLLISKVKQIYAEKFKSEFNISFSIQKPSTDTIAADDKNMPFRDDKGRLLFRPGGHGALLDNLNEIDADIVFIKNIDNVVPDRLKGSTILYKKALAGMLMKVQEALFGFLHQLEKSSDDNSLIIKIKKYFENNIGYSFAESFDNLKPLDQKELLFSLLNRPIRICGMVKNEGEPGGGPYWVKNIDGSLSLQILESSQFNMDNTEQKNVFLKATHFNPVDLIVSMKNFRGEKFDLFKFRDTKTGFISLKSKDGKSLKAFELPGLWNGSMAFWNTIFLEVPVSTFNPVKTINDLLRNEHQ